MSFVVLLRSAVAKRILLDRAATERVFPSFSTTQSSCRWKSTFCLYDDDDSENLENANTSPSEVAKSVKDTKHQGAPEKIVAAVATNDDASSSGRYGGNLRPMTMGERIRYFPIGAKELMKDCMLYKNIHDASRTRLNAWTIKHPFLRNTNGRSDGVIQEQNGFMIHNNEIRPGRIPRRQYEEQRRLEQDISFMIPLLLLWIPPIIGYLPLILAVGAPRQVLTRQFFNDYEIRWYALLEDQQRRRVFPQIQELFWNQVTTERSSRNLGLLGGTSAATQRESDAAGPIIDPLFLYPVFADPSLSTSGEITYADSEHHVNKLLPGALHSILTNTATPPDKYLVPLALAIGINQNLPAWLSESLTMYLLPNRWLRMRIRRQAIAVAEDDWLLLLEGHDQNECQSLRPFEVQDACLMRGLPVNVSEEDMRECLTNHLKMIASVRGRLRKPPTTVDFGLFTLHLSIIRDYFKNH